MDAKKKLIYEGKAKRIFEHVDKDKVIIEFKDDATAFNSQKKAEFKGKGELNCQISNNIFEYLIQFDIPTHFINVIDEKSIVAEKINIIPLEIVLRNVAFGSICRQTHIKPGTEFREPLIDFYLKDDDLEDPLLTRDRIKALQIINLEELVYIEEITYKINNILKEFFFKIDLKLVDFKLEFGKNSTGDIVLADEFSPDNSRLWDLKTENVKMRSLDKDRFRNDLGDLIEAYTEINNRINNFIGSNR
tara:strand:+ start:11715 stop:12455 length:741 start_codon:yes stop_codon:yes gene_type:complete